jgi:hypothetical protein
MSKKRLSFMACLVATAMAGPLAIAQSSMPTTATLEPVIGTWSERTANGLQTITVDGTKPSPATPPPFPLALARDVTNFRGGTISVEFQLIAGASDQSAGIVFNHRPDGSYFFARYNTKDGNVAVWKFESGVRMVLAHGEQHQQLALGAWHRLSVTISGTSVTAVANDRLRVSHTLAAPVQGRVGVWTKADSTTAFRRYVVSQ